MSGEDAEARLVKLVHDLRTPLTVITGFSELLQRRGAELTDEQRDDYVERIAAAAGEIGEFLDAERDGRMAAG